MTTFQTIPRKGFWDSSIAPATDEITTKSPSAGGFFKNSMDWCDLALQRTTSPESIAATAWVIESWFLDFAGATF